MPKSDVSFLDAIGENKSNYTKGGAGAYSSVVKKLMTAFGEAVVKDLQTNLKNERHNASGQLSQSINYTITEGAEITFTINIADYYKFLDKGVKGRESSTLAPNSPYQFKKLNLPKNVILNWMSYKRINTQPKTLKLKGGHKGSASSNISQMKSLAFLIGRSIAKRGLITTNFYSDVINEKTLNQFITVLKAATRRDILIQLSREK